MNLSLKNISKNFSNKKVLQDITLDFCEGKIHGLLGENGAGKSTTANIIYGELLPDSGSLEIDGIPHVFLSPKDSINCKISYVHQRPMVAESLSIYENLRIGLSKDSEKQIPSLLTKWLPEINKNKLVKNLGSDTKFFIALISSLLKNPKILILDEPTALLEDEQKIFLFENLKQMAAEGMNIIVITHNLYEANTYCNDIFYLKNGKLSEYKKEEIKKIEKKSILNTNPKYIIKFENINCKPSNQPGIKNISFTCQSGKITRIKGLSEDGLLTLENVITGFNKEKCSGKITIKSENEEKIINLRKNITPADIRNLPNLKTSIIPTDRKYRGSNPELSIKEILSTNAKSVTDDYIKQIINQAHVKITINEKAENLSGGMLQRLIITREFNSNPDFLILCHPMQGLDPEICETITDMILKEAATGKAILVLTAGDFDSKYCDFNFELCNGCFI